MKKTKPFISSEMPRTGWRARYLRAFGRDEDGSVIILTILLLITMLVMGGMAVDFMRFEARRATLQSVSDRAVLAATNLTQTLDSQAVVEDYFEKAGFADALVGTPVVSDTGNSRTVSVRSEIDINTFYLRLVGMDTLTAPAASSATEGVGKVEISLVLDISGSMRENNRIVNMRAAAIQFANQVLDPANGGQVSLNIIPYAGGTNPGPEMFDYISGNRYARVLPGPDGIVGTDDDIFPFPGPDGVFGTDDDVPYPNVSSCVEFEGSDWSSSGLPGAGRAQMPHFMVYPSAGVVAWGWCPQDENNAIAYALSDAADAVAYINNIDMHDGTGTHYAMKWGLALLDPSTQPAFAHLNGISTDLVPNQFANRPAAWSDPETKKIIVLMTDGRITGQWRPVRPIDAVNAGPTFVIGDKGKDPSKTLTSAATNVTRFGEICDMASHPSRDVKVYTVGFEVSSWPDVETQLRNCASDPTYYFPAAGAGLITVFSGIAEQITDLRLNL